jgi:hypothetical protein
MGLKHHPVPVSAAMLIALAAVGCGSSSSNSASKTPTAESPAPATSAQTSTPAQGSASKSKVAALGASEAAWDAAHVSDNEFPTGQAYDRDPSLPAIEGHVGARYTGVTHEGGRIVEYVYHFSSAPIAAAKRHILSSQFPADAHEVGFTVKPTCAVMLVRSATLRRELRAAVGHPAEGTFVTFNSGPEQNSYDAGAVNTATLSPTASTTPAEAEC